MLKLKLFGSNLMLRSKSFHSFRDENLPNPPPNTVEQLVNLFRPEKEPSFDAHFRDARAFRDWLIQPNANPKGFPSKAQKNNTKLGAWIYLCASEWRERYKEKGNRNALYSRALNTGGSGAIVAILGLIGIDAAADGGLEPDDIGANDVGWTIGGIAAKVGFPIPFNSRQQNAERLCEVMQEIKAHYGR